MSTTSILPGSAAGAARPDQTREGWRPRFKRAGLALWRGLEGLRTGPRRAPPARLARALGARAILSAPGSFATRTPSSCRSARRTADAALRRERRSASRRELALERFAFSRQRSRPLPRDVAGYLGSLVIAQNGDSHRRRIGAAMDRRTLDQTASERLLHRVLYAIKFLRAMVLHVSLAALAALVFATTGVIGLYPVADNMIRAMRAVAIQEKLQGNPLAGAAFWIIAALVIAAAIAALAWVYRSITDVRPKSLRVQAVVIVAVASWNVAGLRDELQFAFDRLDPTFAVIAAIGVGLSLFVFPVSVAISLWQVSRAPERSSLIATLDPRLAPGAWAYWNKLLDCRDAASDRQDPGRVFARPRRRAVAGHVDDVPAHPGRRGQPAQHAVDRLRHPDPAPMSRPVVDLGLADPARAAAVGGRRQGRGAAAVSGQAPRRTERLRRAQAPRRPVPALPTTLRQRRCRPGDTTPAAAEPPVFVPSSRGPGRRGAVRRRRRLPAADRGRQARRRPRDTGRCWRIATISTTPRGRTMSPTRSGAPSASSWS